MLIQLKDKTQKSILCLPEDIHELCLKRNYNIVPTIFYENIELENQKIFLVIDKGLLQFKINGLNGNLYKIFVNNKGIFWVNTEYFIEV